MITFRPPDSLDFFCVASNMHSQRAEFKSSLIYHPIASQVLRLPPIRMMLAVFKKAFTPTSQSIYKFYRSAYLVSPLRYLLELGLFAC